MKTFTLQLFDTTGVILDEFIETEKNKELNHLKGNPLLCKVCRQIITSDGEQMFIQNSHFHTCTNPAGFIFDIRCFHNAPGCTQVGTATAEHTWFTGYRWQITVCRHCGEHLGWFFRNGENFYGLIANCLIHE